MKKCCTIALLSFMLLSCGASKKHREHTGSKAISKDIINASETPKIAKGRTDFSTPDPFIPEIHSGTRRQDLVSYARSFEGTRYKFGGTTDAGMDCSGLIYTVFKKESIIMPRISRDMALEGISIPSLKDVLEGDLIFFKTSRRNVINHVGLVVERVDETIFFIHSTTSRGVIISSLNERYWKDAFVAVRRVL